MISVNKTTNGVQFTLTTAEAQSLIKALEGYGATVNMTLDPDRGWFRLLQAVENAVDPQ